MGPDHERPNPAVLLLAAVSAIERQQGGQHSNVTVDADALFLRRWRQRIERSLPRAQVGESLCSGQPLTSRIDERELWGASVSKTIDGKSRRWQNDMETPRCRSMEMDNMATRKRT